MSEVTSKHREEVARAVGLTHGLGTWVETGEIPDMANASMMRGLVHLAQSLAQRDARIGEQSDALIAAAEALAAANESVVVAEKRIGELERELQLRKPADLNTIQYRIGSASLMAGDHLAIGADGERVPLFCDDEVNNKLVAQCALKRNRRYTLTLLLTPVGG